MSRPFRFGAQLAWPASPEGWAATARRVESLGYSVLTVPDHLGDQLAPTPAVAWAAAATSTLRVGHLVANNDRAHPAFLARDAATLDLLSGGRLELGLGAGWLAGEYAAVGVDLDPAGVRVERLGEAVAVLKALLGGGPVSFEGRHYRLDGLQGLPRPVQRPRPPLLVGGGGRRVLTLAGREADIVSVNYNLAGAELAPEVARRGTAAATAERVGWVRDAAHGRAEEPELSVSVHATLVTDRRHEAARGLGSVVGLSADEVLASPHFAVGTPTEIGDDLCRRRDRFGFSYVVFGGSGWEAMAPVVARLAGR